MENRFVLKLIRFALSLLRRFKPVLRLGKRVFVTRYADVVDVLKRDGEFTIRQINAANMDRITGPFILGMDCPHLDREAGILQGARRSQDPERIREEVTGNAAQRIDALRRTGRIDVVGQFARAVAADLEGSYLGVPGPDPKTLMRWNRTIFHDIFLNFTADPKIRQAGERSGKELKTYLLDLIGQREQQLESGQDVPDDFLSRLVRMQSDPETRLDADGIRRNISGVLLGAVETTSKVVTIAVNELLRRPDVLSQAQAAANQGDFDRVHRYTWEAMRFNPHNPIVLRYSDKEALVAGRRIPAGKQVFVVTLSAMFDSSVFPRPGSFRVDRPLENYLHFGYGIHRCFGEYVNEVQIPLLMMALLRLKNLRRASGSAGKIRFDGPFPDRLILEFDG